MDPTDPAAVNTTCLITWPEDKDAAERTTLQTTIADALDDSTVTFDWRKQPPQAVDTGQSFDRGLIGSEPNV